MHHHTPQIVSLLAALLLAAIGCDPDLRDGAFADQEVAGSTSGGSTSGATGGGTSGGTTADRDAGVTDVGGAPDTDNTTIVDAGGVLEVGGGELGGIPDMTGTWIQVQDLSTCVVVGNPVELRTRYLIKIRIEQEGVELRETYDVCRVGNTPLLNLVTTVPRAVLRASSGFQVRSHLLGTRDNQGYVGGVQTHLWGLRMDDPITEPFPRPILMDDGGEPILDDNGNFIPDESHPNLIDSDQDGNPGATLNLGGDACQVYMIQRALTSLTGDVRPDGTIEGIPYSRTQQFIMTANNPICGQSFETFSNNAFSRGKMWRASAFNFTLDTNGDGDVSCEELIAAESQIIQWLEPDDARCRR